MQTPTSPEHGPTAPVAVEDDDRYVTIDVEVSGDLEARWVYDCERDTMGLMLRHLT